MKCSFCRNDNATNEHPYEGDFVFYMCNDCDKRYLEHKQLGPKYLICNCNPSNPKELELDMAVAELKAKPKKYAAYGSYTDPNNTNKFTTIDKKEVKEFKDNIKKGTKRKVPNVP